MKKILIICLVLFTCLISGCSKNYKSIYEEIKNMELKEVFTSEEEKLAFFERVQENYTYKEYFNSESKIIKYNYTSDGKVGTKKFTQNTKYQQINNKLIAEYKTVGDTKETKKYTYSYVSYFEKGTEYRKDSEGKKLFRIYGTYIHCYQYIGRYTYRDLDKTFFLELYNYGGIEKIGQDSNGNIVVVQLIRDEGIEKYVFKDERIVEYECVIFKEGKINIYCIEKYNYKKNYIKYPDFSDYVTSF